MMAATLQVQTGVPFGEVRFVRDWLGVQGEVRRPRKEHAKRPVEGFACQRSEVIGCLIVFCCVHVEGRCSPRRVGTLPPNGKFRC